VNGSPDLEWLIDVIATGVRAGRAPQGSCRQLIRVFPEEMSAKPLPNMSAGPEPSSSGLHLPWWRLVALLEASERAPSLPRSEVLRHAMRRLRRRFPLCQFEDLEQHELRAMVIGMFAESLQGLQGDPEAANARSQA
jgi:hypothetical protein